MPERNPHPRGLIPYDPVTQADHDTIIAALRFWQDTVVATGITQSTNGWTLCGDLPDVELIEHCAEQAIDVATQNGIALDSEEIDALITHLKDA